MTVIGIGAAILLVLLNGFFVATEFAFVAVRRSRVEQLAADGRARARILLSSLRGLDRSIATTQLGITVCGLALGWLGEPAIGRVIGPPIEAAIGPLLSDAVTAFVSAAFAFIIITFVLIVVGELAPKSLALQRTEGVALFVAPPMAVLSRVFRPATVGLNAAGKATVRALGVSPTGDDAETLEPEEIEIVLQASARAGLLSSSELFLARRALEFGEIRADQIMVPRTEVVAIEATASHAEVLAIVEAHTHARFPVYEESLDGVVGILDVKDLLAPTARGETEWRSLVRPAVAIPESVSVEVAVSAMRSRQVQIVILVDEHGGTSGILTADEVLYRLLGKWLGGRTSGEEAVRTLPRGNLLLSGLALIADVEEATGAELADEDYDTVGGFMMARLGRIPKTGDRILVPGYEFRIMAMDGRRVDRVLVLRRDADEHPAGESGPAITG